MRVPFALRRAGRPAETIPVPPHAWSPRDAAVVVAAVCAFWVVAASLWWLAGGVVPWDSKNHFYPMLRHLGAALAQGEWPLWNPYHFSGHPAVADPQSLLFTPTMVAFAWLVPTPSMELFDTVVFAHLLLPAFAVLAYFARKGWHPAGAVFAAMMIILGGSAAARLQHTGMIFSYAFFLPAYVFLEGALTAPTGRPRLLQAAGFSLCAALMALGRDQIAFLGTLTLAGLVLHLTLTRDRPVPWFVRRLPILLGMGLAVVALLAVPALLTLQFLMDSNRPAIAYGVAAMNAMPPSSLATLLAPNIFGTLNLTYDYWGPMWDTVPEGTYTDRAINYLFAGTLPMVLILWQGIGRRGLAAREIRFFVVLLAVALVYAFGRYTPIFVRLFDHVPGISLYRRPADATFYVNIALAILAGYSLHRYVRTPRVARPGRDWGRLAAGAVAALLPAGLIAVGVTFSLRVGHGEAALIEAAAFLAIALLGLSLAMPQPTARTRAMAAAAIVAITGGELLWRNAASSLNMEPATRYAVYNALSPSDYAGLAMLKRELDERHARGERPRVEILGLGGAWQNASMVLGLEDTVGYNALRIAEYERAVGSGENAVELSLRQFPGTFRGYRCSLASLLGLEYLVLDRPAEKLPRHFPRLRQATLLHGSDTLWIYRLAPAAPRAYVATQLKPVDVDGALDQEELPEFDRTQAALIDKSDVELLDRSYPDPDRTTGTPPSHAVVTILAYKRNKVTLEVSTEQPGVLVLHDLYYPGWDVKVDGEPMTVLRANLLFRGVEVPAGHHRVEFTFRPLSRDNLLAAAAGLVRSRDGLTPVTIAR